MVRSIARTVRLPIAVALLIIAFACGVLASDVQTPSCTTALLVIDVQHIWLSRGIMYTADNTHITDKIAEILPLARQAGVPVVFIKDVSERGRTPEYRLDMPVAIAPIDGDYVSEKRVGNAFSYTDLHSMLQDLGVTRVLITGLASHSCVSDTVWGARVKGYEVVILEDGHTGGSGGRIAEQQNTLWTSQGLGVIASSELDWDSQCMVGVEADNSDDL
jgi:nicotinamidase-related amidase